MNTINMTVCGTRMKAKNEMFLLTHLRIKSTFQRLLTIKQLLSNYDPVLDSHH